MRARLDDLRAGNALEFALTGTPLVAETPDEVSEVLAEVERVTERGAWAIGFVAYEAAAGLGLRPPCHPGVDGLPLAWFVVCSAPERGPAIRAPGPGRYDVGPWCVAWSADRHRSGVAYVREQIAHGNTYQANLTTRMTAPVSGDLSALYADLACAQQSSYCCYLDLGEWVIASASPELFFDTCGPILRTKPMKGTAPRGGNDPEDRRIAAELLGSDKNRAENIMIVDLMRNDMATLPRCGDVLVRRLLTLDSYPTVHQLTSEIVVPVSADMTLVDIFDSLFPCGSVTGAPKVSTMRILRDIEDGPRGVYCGALGFVAPPGEQVRARFSVAIRTAVINRVTETITYGTGGGIVWDSDPAAEYDELLAKSRILPSQAGVRGVRRC